MEKKDFFASLCLQVKACSLKRALSLAESSGYNLDIVSAIIKRGDCLVLYMWMLLEETPRVLPIIKTIVESKNFKEVSFKKFLWLFARVKQESGESTSSMYDALKIADERKILNKFSVEELLNFSETIGYIEPVVQNIGRKKAWKELDLNLALRKLNRTDSSAMAKIVINKKECSLETALDIFDNHRYPEEIFEGLIDRHDFPLSLILSKMEDPKWGKIEEVIMQNVYAVISRKDCSIELSYELLERARKYNSDDSFLCATMALIGKNNLPFDRAIALMKGISCHKDAVVSFESRKDFTVARRVELVETMEECIITIYESGSEPRYDSYDLEEIIKKGDWLSPALCEVLNLNKKLRGLCSPLKIISEREDWQALSFSEAVKLAAETGNQVDVKYLIIMKKDCLLSEALNLAKFEKAINNIYDAYLLNAIIRKGIASFEESLEFLKKSNDPMSTVATLVEKTVVPLEEMMKLFRNGFDNLLNLCSTISKSEDWKTVSLEKAFDFLKDTYKEPLNVIVGREDWKLLPFQTAYDFLSKIDWTGYYRVVIPSLTIKKDCPLKIALELVNLLESKLDIKEALYPVTSRLDNPLEDALELSQKTFYKSFGGIVLRQDWKELSLEKACQYIEKYQNHELVASLGEREDWQALSFKEAVGKLPELDSYCRSIYLGLIILNEKYSLKESLAIVEENKYEHMLANKIIRRSDCSLDLASDVFKKADFSFSMSEAMLSRDDWKNMPLADAFEFARNTSTGFYSSIVEREDWKTLSLAKSLQFVEKCNHHNSVMASVASRKDWGKKERL